MKKVKQADYILIGCFFVWILLGLIVLNSASSAVAYQRFSDSYFFIKKQVLLGLLPGLFLFFIFAKINYNKLKKIAWPLFALSTLLLVLVFIPGIGSNYGTRSNSWIILLGNSFQPAEFAKFAMIIFLAYIISKKTKDMTDFKNGFLLVFLYGMIPIFLVLMQPDLGSVVIMYSILVGMLFVANTSLKHMSALLIFSILALVVMIIIAPYRAERLMTFLHPELDPQGQGYHINQAYLAVGSGGWFGRGYNQSLQKFQYLPEVASDSIFAIMAEEMGFIFSFLFILLIFYITHRSLRIAKGSTDEFGRLLVVGIIVWFFVQSFFNISAMLGLMPLTGVPLPFVSHGGTAMAIAMAGVGVLINVSKKSELI